jgi:DNA polymerase-3 subunit delta
MATYTEIKKDLQKGKISRLYLLLGPQEYLARRLISQIMDLALGNGLRDFNYVDLDTSTVDAPTLLHELNAYPLGASRRVIILKQIRSLSASAEKALQESMANLPDFLTLILTADRVDRRKALYREISKAGTTVDLGPLPPYEVKNWIKEMLQDEGKQISPKLVDTIFELTGSDLSDVANEVNNLVAYMGERAAVAPEDVEALVASRRKEPIYMLTEAIANREFVSAAVVLQQLLSEGESELRILWHLDNTVKRLLRAKCLLEDGINEDVVAKTLQVRPFLKARFLQQVRSFSLEELRKMYHSILLWDNKFKSTSRWHPDIDLELLLMELCTTREN